MKNRKGSNDIEQKLKKIVVVIKMILFFRNNVM